jgi:hypothetical protein
LAKAEVNVLFMAVRRCLSDKYVLLPYANKCANGVKLLTDKGLAFSVLCRSVR